MTHKYIIKSEGGKRYLIIDYRGASFAASVADSQQCMREVIELLGKTNADLVVLAEVYERVYNEEQTKMLKEIADLASLFHRESVWSHEKIAPYPECEGLYAARHNLIMSISTDLIFSDPIAAYLKTISAIKQEEERLSSEGKAYKKCAEPYLKVLNFMRNAFEKTELIKKAKLIISRVKQIPKDRSIYRTLFQVEIKPAFVSSRVFFKTPVGVELVDQYEVLDANVNIYKHPEKIQYLYYISPPEYNLSPEEYMLLTRTREIVSNYHPEGIQFMEASEIREYFKKVYEATIADLAQRNDISLSGEQVRRLAGIVARYTVGYGMMELLLSDRKLTDIYMDAPLGSKPVYVVHSDYGSCQTNVLFTEREAKGIISRLRAQSGRPFDEAHPVFDMDMHDLKTRVAVIGPPLSPDGVAFALRLHKETPWTLPQFIDVKMLNSLTAGMLSFFVDAQASTLVNGARGSGKTSMLMALMLEILPSLRIIVQEDTLEIPVQFMRNIGYNIQRLKTQSAIAVSRTSAEVPPEEALRTALRLGDSVLIIGEVRSKEAQVLYEAMRIGAVGNVVMGTIHGENAYSVWDRIVNDLEVPNTSFKATDVIVTCAPIRFKGSIRRERRLIEITEVGKHWYEEPEKEGGLIKLVEFDTSKDNQYVNEKEVKRSELFPRIAKSRGLKIKELWDDIYARASVKQYMVDMKRKYKIPELLEASHTVPANDKWLLILERQREEHGSVNYKEAEAEWKKWLLEAHVKPLISRGGKGGAKK
ncbi:hypothetical protein DRN74_00155 [Candidatus Micrarchaeota archaeon]|mgnify:CR=1 FL=1|nr:MAG: hypothetical protein DRN74_00155 [Candidatus Micrarchaeota archaeon]